MQKKQAVIENVLEALYETEANAILNSTYPVILGHFFAAHSYAVNIYNWFGVKPEHIEIIKSGAQKVIDACIKKEAMIDITGIHCGNLSYEEKQKADGFLFDFQRWFIKECKQKNLNTRFVFRFFSAINNTQYIAEVFYMLSVYFSVHMLYEEAYELSPYPELQNTHHTAS